MRPRSFLSASPVILLFVLCSGCLKDTVMERYTFYRPLYQTREAVRAGIRSTSPQPLQHPGKIFLRGQYLFLNDLNRGIHVIDISDAAAPKQIAFINIPGNVDMAVKGNYLYADQFTDLITFDISDPRNVVPLNFDDKVFPSQHFVPDSNLVMAGWVKVDTLIRHTDRWSLEKRFDAAPFMNATAQSSAGGAGKGGSMARFGLINDRLYTVSNFDLRVFNITNPADPFFVRSVFPSRGNIETIYPFRDKLFIGSMTGMFIYSVANPDVPVANGVFSHATACDPVIADDNYAFVTLRSGTMCGGPANQMDVVNVADINSPRLVKTYPFTQPFGLDKDGDQIFLCDGKAGLRILNAADLDNISTRQTISGMETYDVIASAQTAIVVAKDGLYFINYATPGQAFIRSKITVQN